MTIAALLGAGAARAQNLFDRGENISVADRPRPEYDALGVPVGGFLIFPKLTLGAADNDNILAIERPALNDAVFTIQPQIKIESNWNQNAVSLTANTTVDRFARYGFQNSDQYAFIGQGTLNVFHDLTLTGEASQARVLIPPTAAVVFSATPLLYDETQAKVEAVKTFNRISLTASGDFERLSYLDGFSPFSGVVDQRYRDHDAYIGEVRGDYAVTPDLALFLEQTVAHNNYDRNAFKNQDIYETLLGPNFQIKQLVTAEIGVGYLTSTFSGPGAKSIGTVHGRARIAYFPTELITVTLTADQGVFDSGLPSSPAYLSTDVGAQADYELLRNLIITAKVEGVENKYRVIDRRDYDVVAKVSATYLINRDMKIAVEFDNTNRSSFGVNAGRRFNDDVVSLNLTLQL